VLLWFFCFFDSVKLKPFKRIPAFIAIGIILFVCLVRILNFEFFDRLERMTYDMRQREALKFGPAVATNLGFVFINEDSLKAVWNGDLGYRYGLLWPRQVYGRLIQELSEQGAKAVALDILFSELRPDQPSVQMADNSYEESDVFFAAQMRAASNVIIAVMKDAEPPELFLTNAMAAGDITTDKDADGILRRVQIYRRDRRWHRVFLEDQPKYDLDLVRARLEPGRLVVPKRGENDVIVALDADGNFDLASVGAKRQKGEKPKDKPFVDEPIWHMGVLLAAHELQLDLSRAEVDLAHGRITLRGARGLTRVIPVDSAGYAYVNWSLPPNAPQLTQEPIQELLLQNRKRLKGQTQGLTNRWRGKLAVVGSSAVIGNNLTDRGATPLSKDTLLVSKHWNVANSIITDRFVRRSSLAVDLALIVLLGIISAILTWELRAVLALVSILLFIAAYAVLGTFLYAKTRLWIPLALPAIGGLLMTHICVVTWRVVFEEAERRRVRSIFSGVVSEKIVAELLSAKSLSLGGARREITVLFADVRGFTEFTDTTQERVAEFVQKHNLTGDAAETCFGQQARETLDTVNLYLGLSADVIIRHDGTLDKFIGDCVMAFWGAPTPNPKHASACVRAAIEGQRAIYELNQQRATENAKRELENLARVAAGLEPLSMLPILQLGTGINSGMATAGLMGSQAKQKSYTVFGREVNLASRLEGLSGRGRIFISETTYQHLLQQEPELARTCIPQPPQKVKGISSALKVYEAPWRSPDSHPLEEELPKKDQALTDSTTFTGFAQR
jgi:class 3 adenylate cyclase/CHASE2 domain-containing sensor protein